MPLSICVYAFLSIVSALVDWARLLVKEELFQNFVMKRTALEGFSGGRAGYYNLKDRVENGQPLGQMGRYNLVEQMISANESSTGYP